MKKVLYLDNDSCYYIEQINEHIPASISDERLELFGSSFVQKFYKNSHYLHDKREVGFLSSLIESATEKSVDLIVIGNNLGAGIWKAEHVNEKMRGKTIIVFNSYKEEELLPYQKMGFEKFSTRNIKDLCPIVLETLSVRLGI